MKLADRLRNNHEMPTTIELEAADAIADALDALEMVRDADEDCHKDGLRTIPSIARARIDRAIAKLKGE